MLVFLYFFPFLHWKEMLNVAAFCFCMTVKEIGNLTFVAFRWHISFQRACYFIVQKRGEKKWLMVQRFMVAVSWCRVTVTSYLRCCSNFPTKRFSTWTILGYNAFFATCLNYHKCLNHTFHDLRCSCSVNLNLWGHIANQTTALLLTYVTR